eukprot:scaffold260603_cov18-Tisochrysis_lutea.AAC.1
MLKHRKVHQGAIGLPGYPYRTGKGSASFAASTHRKHVGHISRGATSSKRNANEWSDKTLLHFLLQGSAEIFYGAPLRQMLFAQAAGAMHTCS